MTEGIVVLVTAGTRDEAERLAQALVGERLAACVNVIPGLTSIYRWEGKICQDQESLLLVKTRRARLRALTRRVQGLHPYTLPEIITLSLSGGSASYLSWVEQSTR